MCTRRASIAEATHAVFLWIEVSIGEIILPPSCRDAWRPIGTRVKDIYLSLYICHIHLSIGRKTGPTRSAVCPWTGGSSGPSGFTFNEDVHLGPRLYLERIIFSDILRFTYCDSFASKRVNGSLPCSCGNFGACIISTKSTSSDVVEKGSFA